MGVGFEGKEGAPGSKIFSLLSVGDLVFPKERDWDGVCLSKGWGTG